MTPERLTSHNNPKIRDIRLLQEKSKERRDEGLFVAEGKKETERAVKYGFTLQELYLCPELSGEEYYLTLSALSKGKHKFKIFYIPRALYSKIAYRDGTEGVIAIFRTRSLKLNEVKLSPSPLIIVLESVEKPGNLGAVIRTADAVNADAVIVCDPLTDLFNPNIIRASIGTLFTRQICLCTSQEAFNWLKKNNITIYTAQLQDSTLYTEQQFNQNTAIVMGTESQGLTNFWRERADCKIKIPMLGAIDSLNVSVSAAIICYEVLRQRNLRE